ncbi:Fc.00g025020.m01.CDS01 [Cosmosporella sp. VM-42]
MQTTKDKVEFRVKNPFKWTAETTNLYAWLSTAAKAVLPRVPVNFRGVNRHERHPDSDRAVPYEYLKRDLMMMKKANINAIRTPHYPNDPRLYDFADEIGLWIIDETDLECHGFDWIGEESPAHFTSDNPT